MRTPAKSLMLPMGVALLVAGACGGEKQAAQPAAAGACMTPTGGCYEHPANRKDSVATLERICLNEAGAKWLPSCPRQDATGGCKTSNPFDKGAPTIFHYKSEPGMATAEDVKKACVANSEIFVAP
jgi:hypothetical protein